MTTRRLIWWAGTATTLLAIVLLAASGPLGAAQAQSSAAKSGATARAAPPGAASAGSAASTTVDGGRRATSVHDRPMPVADRAAPSASSAARPSTARPVAAADGGSRVAALALAPPLPGSSDGGTGGKGQSASEYRGIVPGRLEQPNPLGVKVEAGTPPTLTWTGFQPGESSSKVFFQLTAPVQYQISESEGQIAVVLRNCRVYPENNLRRIDTRYFATPVRHVTPVQRGNNVRAQLVLKMPTTYSVQAQTERDGYYYVMLEFPPGEPDTAAPVAPQGALKMTSDEAGEQASSSTKPKATSSSGSRATDGGAARRW